jgi:hypothetical protein
MKVQETEARTVLVRSGLPDVEYVVSSGISRGLSSRDGLVEKLHSCF